MDYRDKLIADLVEKKCQLISRKTIRSLQKMTKGMQSGDDSPLKNVWDEICVQVQGEESVMWDAYLAAIQDIIQSEVFKLDTPTKKAIWLQTDNGVTWEPEDDKDAQISPYNEEDIVNYIRGLVLSAAMDWENKRIEKYREYSHGD